MYPKPNHNPILDQRFDQVVSMSMLIETMLLQPPLVSNLIEYHGLMCRWLLSVVTDVPVSAISQQRGAVIVNDNVPGLRLPLPAQVPTQFSVIPEFFVEDMMDFMMFVAQVDPLQLNGHASAISSFLTLVVACLQQPVYMNKPHLRVRRRDSHSPFFLCAMDFSFCVGMVTRRPRSVTLYSIYSCSQTSAGEQGMCTPSTNSAKTVLTHCTITRLHSSTLPLV